MTTPFENKRVVLGVTGSIACYKAVELASSLTQNGAQVEVILTQAAAEFVTPLTFQSVTGRQAYVDADLWGSQGHILHVGLGRQADVLVIAPVTANTLAKLAQGSADNLLTLTALAASCPILLAPAMDAGMYAHPAVQANVDTLRERGALFVGPTEGHLASGLRGLGRLVEPEQLISYIRWVLARGGPLQDSKVIVTAGGTQEPIDPVRVITNRSSGKQGFALAQAALDLGAEVTLIAAPTQRAAPVGAKREDVRTAQEMSQAVLAAAPQADILIMAAAVADFTPAAPIDQKIKKDQGIPEVVLKPAPDILMQVSEQKSESGSPLVTVGFAAESQDLIQNARAKLESKGLDLIAANDIASSEAGFEVDTNRVTLLFADGRVIELPLMTKSQVAQAILEHCLAIIQKRN
jgi:phosphopantothenoylcysteine decarboxylase/phosphopantothenate--cysteine ligase